MTTKVKVTVHNAPLAALLGVKPGDIVSVDCKQGVPVSREWRNRFKDAEIDGCVSIAQNSKKPAKTTEGDK
jgi:hypothetical protein